MDLSTRRCDWLSSNDISDWWIENFNDAFRDSGFFDGSFNLTAIKCTGYGNRIITVHECWSADDDYVNLSIHSLNRKTTFNLPEKYVHGDLLTGNISLNSAKHELKGDNWNVSAEVSLLHYKGFPRYNPWETMKTGYASFNKVSDNDNTGYLSIGDLNWTCPNIMVVTLFIVLESVSTRVFGCHSNTYDFNVDF